MTASGDRTNEALSVRTRPTGVLQGVQEGIPLAKWVALRAGFRTRQAQEYLVATLSRAGRFLVSTLYVPCVA